MDLSTITMEPEKAKEAFEAYHTQVQRRHSLEDEQIMRGYKALSKGQQLISLRQTLRAGGVEVRRLPSGATTLPRLAVIRADSEWCWSHGIQEDGSVRFSMDEWTDQRATRRRLDAPPGTFERPEFRSWRRVRAMVPTVPPPLRPAHALSNYHIMWEADWKSLPPRDPALLKRIGGDLFAVLAVWDLTELERAVLAGRTEG